MQDYTAIIGIVVSSLLALLLLLLGIIGYFFAQWMRAINKNLECLPVIQVELAGMKVKVDQQGAVLADTNKRLGSVEAHVSNTERIGLLEQRISSNEKEIESLRRHWHRMNEIMGMVTMKLEISVPSVQL
jgi:hypothetical protein